MAIAQTSGLTSVRDDIMDNLKSQGKRLYQTWYYTNYPSSPGTS
ncbi:MAG: hypothetical protein GY799_31680 [Desulfobulbaceae bacterium]|nr:hypothetical protein [Desulfobulbaceae bacterium]